MELSRVTLLAGVFSGLVLSGPCHAARARMRLDVLPPLTSARCAEALVVSSLNALPTPYGQLTLGELRIIEAVRPRAPEIRTFLKTMFPRIVRPPDHSLAPYFALIWSRIPEVRPREQSVQLPWTEARIEDEWRDFYVSAHKVAIQVGPYRPILNVRLYRNSGFSAVLRRIDPTLLTNILRLEPDAERIIAFFEAHLPPSPTQAKDWLERRVDTLWTSVFGEGRPWRLVRDGDRVAILREDSPQARRRLVDELRLLQMMIHLHRGD